MKIFTFRSLTRNGNLYLRRWYVLPKNRVVNIYIHQLVHGDEIEHLHDHPWNNCSIVLEGLLREQTRDGNREYRTGSVIRRVASQPHRLSVDGQPVLTLFITGRTVRDWGFYIRTAAGDEEFVDHATFLNSTGDKAGVDFDVGVNAK